MSRKRNFIMSKFTENLDVLIKNKGITKNQLLKELKLGKNSIINWDTRNTLPNGNTLVRIADYFAVSIDELIGRTFKNQLYDKNNERNKK